MSSPNTNKLLHPYGQLDVLGYYGKVAPKLVKFLKGKEIATKTWIPNGPTFLNRGSKFEPLFIEELKIEDTFLKLRSEIHKLEDARSKISPVQEKLWKYFLPRKYCDLFYATNNEGAGKPIERLFFDIDLGEGTKQDDSRRIAAGLVNLIRQDDPFNKLIGKYKLQCMFTGRSFHVYVLLARSINHEFYDRYLQFSKKEPQATFTGRWAKAINEKLMIKVVGGHEKAKGFINIDPSQTPSGKLARAPFSLHMKDARNVDGVAVPVREEMLADKYLIKVLRKYSPEKVVDELDELSSMLECILPSSTN